MWKYGLVGLWCACVCLAAVYLTVRQRLSNAPTEAAFPVLTEHHVVSSDMVTVPIVKEGKVDGYFLAQVALTANDEAYHRRSYPAGVDLTDQLITFLQSGTPILADRDFSLETMRSDLVGQMNRRFGEEVFYKALVARLDYLTADDLHRLRDPARHLMKAVSLIEKDMLDVAPDRK
nr:hypothetical protein [Brucella anthropi]